jgi:hypothetical protein
MEAGFTRLSDVVGFQPRAANRVAVASDAMQLCGTSVAEALVQTCPCHEPRHVPVVGGSP